MLRAAIYAHFDIDEIVDPHVYFQLRCLRPYFDIIYLVSTCQLGWRDLRNLSSLVDRVICRENVGYDFMSWRTGFELLPIEACDEFTIINDSCYGPIFDIGFCLDRMTRLRCDLTSLTINYQFARHAQSNFVRFGRRLLRSGFASAFWRSVEAIPDKMSLIMAYEVGLSEMVVNAGYSVGGLVDLKTIDAPMRRRVLAANEPIEPTLQGQQFRAFVESCEDPNPNQAFWSESIACGSPMVKVELLRDNLLGTNLRKIVRIIASENFFDLRVIDSHLNRLRRYK